MEILKIFTLRHIPLAELHQSSYCLYESVVSLKSYAMECFGWETSFGEFNNSPKKQTSVFCPLGPNFFRGAALFELWMTKIGRAVQKLFDSTFKLEIPIPTPNEGVLRHNSPNKNFYCCDPQKAHPWSKPNLLAYNMSRSDVRSGL
jgi:hypothetical protein